MKQGTQLSYLLRHIYCKCLLGLRKIGTAIYYHILIIRTINYMTYAR